MDGTLIGASSDHDRLGKFTSGNTEYRAKRDRIAARLAQLIADYDPTPSQKQLLAIIAGHLDDAERARSLVQRVRAANAARRLLATIPPKPAPPPMSIAEFERLKREGKL